MAFRLWRRKKIAPWIHINLSKGGPSLSFGPRGAKVTMGARGMRATGGIPGAGIFYTKRIHTRPGSKRRQTARMPGQGRRKPLELSFFDKLFMPKEEENFVYGCREYVKGNSDEALEHLAQAAQITDAAYLAGVLAFKNGDLERALDFLLRAEKSSDDLGRMFSKYGIAPELYVSLTEEIGLHLGANTRDLLLLLVELFQDLGRTDDALRRTRLLLQMDEDDMTARLSHVELLFASKPGSAKNCKEIISLADGVENDSPIHTAFLYYKAKALRELKLLSAARDLLTRLLRRKKSRPRELLCAILYERALVNEELGRGGASRKDLESVYAMDPDYEDVAARLGIE